MINPKTSNTERLQKFLANLGYGSRRTIEKLIIGKRIHINGEIAKLGDRVSLSDTILLDSKVIHIQKKQKEVRKIIVYNKPIGEICSNKDPKNRNNVFTKLPKLKNGRWISVGRLDINTSGLLLFTNDGELANRLMHPSYQIEREYAVRVMGNVTEQNIKNVFDGVELEDGKARFTDIVESGGTGINRWFHVCLLEGKNREVRRLWESQGLTVSRLKRVRFANIIIPDHLRSGSYKELEKSIIQKLSQLVGLE